MLSFGGVREGKDGETRGHSHLSRRSDSAQLANWSDSSWPQASHSELEFFYLVTS